MKLKEINLFHLNAQVDNSWIDVSKQSDPILWNLLTSHNIDENNIKYNTDSNEEIHGNIYAKQNK